MGGEILTQRRRDAECAETGWKKVRLGEVCDVRDGTHASPKEASSGRLLLTSKNLIGGRLSFEKSYLISNDDADEIDRRSKVDQWDVLFSMIGTVGEIAVVKENPEFAIKNVGLFKTNGNKELAHWVYYYFRSPIGKMQVYERLQGTTQQYITLGQLREFPIPLPPLPTQRKIAAVLGALDDKIENNRKICANLEAQAQAIFKSWFVDFEPFGGKMPQGWKMGKLGDVAEITMGQSPDGKSLNDVDDGITFFQGRAEFGNRFPTKRLSTTQPNRMAKAGDVLLSVRAPVGDLNIALEDCCIGRGLAAIRSKAGSQSFIYCLLKTLKPAFDLYEGAGTIFGSINKDSLHGLDVVVPDSGWIEKFESVVSSHDRMYRERELESRALAATRDALLPKLMSGEIDVEKVEVA